MNCLRFDCDTSEALACPRRAPMEDVIEAIPVRDTNGDELTLYEYQRFIPLLRRLRCAAEQATSGFHLIPASRLGALIRTPS
jgi:hypothetical protein